MDCPTGKSVYRSQRAAWDALQGIAARREQRDLEPTVERRGECRTYECGECFGWHLTSTPLGRDAVE